MSSVKGIMRRVWDETPKLKGVVLEVSADVATRYRRPGQVVVFRPRDGGEVYMAIASAPGEAAALEFLMGGAAFEKIAPAEGGEVTFDPPTGNGYPLEMASGKDVLLFAVGSALAPIRPVIETIRRDRGGYGRVVLYVGAHTHADFPYRSQYDAWKRDRIDVVRSVSRPYVQERFAEDPGDVSNAVAFVCGMREMMEGVETALAAAGVLADRIGKNW